MQSVPFTLFFLCATVLFGCVERDRQAAEYPGSPAYDQPSEPAGAYPVVAEQPVVVDGPPPASVEVVPAYRPGYVWTRGYWWWGGRGYVWRPGGYVVTRPGYVWVGPRYYYRGGVHYYYRPYYRPYYYRPYVGHYPARVYYYRR